MDRREALSMVSLICGGTIVGASGFLAGCTENHQKSIMGLLDSSQQRLIEEFAEIILPKSVESPGAKDVEIGKFINSIVSDCYSELEQQAFLDGLIKLDEISEQSFGNTYLKLSVADKNELIQNLESEAKLFNQSRQSGNPPHYYSLMKQLTIWGYLSSEMVGTKVMRFTPIPGRYEGCLPYENGANAFS